MRHSGNNWLRLFHDNTNKFNVKDLLLLFRSSIYLSFLFLKKRNIKWIVSENYYQKKNVILIKISKNIILRVIFLIIFIFPFLSRKYFIVVFSLLWVFHLHLLSFYLLYFFILFFINIPINLFFFLLLFFVTALNLNLFFLFR